MKRPDVESVLRPLKPFQRATVDHAFERLFLAPDSTARFLVADEVGLGKTLVARGIIARTIEHLWDKVTRIDVIYICSNQNIARANLPKLQIAGEGERSFALATRLTMLAHELAPREGEPERSHSKVNLVSFTPATSFHMGNSGGKAKERRVLFHLLEPLVAYRKPLMNLLQGTVTRTDRWRYRLIHDPLAIEPGIRARFEKAFRHDRKLRNRVDEVIETWFLRHKEQYPPEARRARNEVLGELRSLLARICIDALDPNLVIVDEFQRFKSLLENRTEYRDPAAEIAQALFQAQTPEGGAVRTLLLSATPYKLYTTDAEIDHEDHYQDFLATTRFLMADDDVRVADLRGRLAAFGAALKRAAHGDGANVIPAKAGVEQMLRSVMARTERVSATEDRDAMVKEPSIRLDLRPIDVRQYLGADALFRAVGDHDPMPLWKSAPYLANFMQGYKLNERLAETLMRSPEKVATVLREHPDAFLRPETIEGWAPVDPANARLRELVSDLLDTGLWKLLWIPPTVPYWSLDGAYAGQEGRTKSLVFSAWNVVPDVVSAVVSYEAERRMVGGQMASYLDPDRQQRGLLRLTRTKDDGRFRHRLLLLLLPCLRLADEAHPLGAPPGMDRRAWVRERVEALLSDPALPNPGEGEVDDRWEWVIPLLLDPGMRTFLEAWRDAEPGEDGVPGTLPKPNPEIIPAYIDDLLALDPAELGRRPEGLADLVTELALGAPGVLAARMLASTALGDHDRRVLALHLANAFWKLFNRPAVIKLLHQLHEQAEADDDDGKDTVYWRQVLRYCADGNLQAVLDEAWHLTWEQYAWSERESAESIARNCIRDLAASVEPRPSRVHAHLYKANGSQRVDTDVVRLRTVLALRFGNITTEEGALSQDAVRSAFNSPFRPFVLASTSIGQEGLDFHPWCRRLVHWNLPGNPVDLEQREGRVHRYKGHAVRRNVAERHGENALARWRPGFCLWSIMFDLANDAARALGASDLVPFWMAPGDTRVERRVPLLPYTSEVQGFQRLKRQLAAYRVVFGQPRQEELMTLLEHSDVDLAELKEWSIDLTPRRSDGGR
jgi:hypothetical protein